MVQRTRDTSQLPLDKVVCVPVMQVVQVVDIPFVSQSIQQFMEVPQLQYVFWLSMSLLCWSCRFSGAAVEKTFVFPQLQLVGKTSRSLCLP